MAIRLSNYPVTSNAGTKQNNPTTATVMADTGQITNAMGGAGTYEVLIVASADAAAIFQVEHRNFANAANISGPFIFFCAASGCSAIPFRFFVNIDPGLGGERIRVMMNANLTGNAAASVQIQRVA